MTNLEQWQRRHIARFEEDIKNQNTFPDLTLMFYMQTLAKCRDEYSTNENMREYFTLKINIVDAELKRREEDGKRREQKPEAGQVRYLPDVPGQRH